MKMGLSRWAVMIWIGTLMTLLVVAGQTAPAVAADGPIKWRMQAVWSASSTAYKAGEKFCADLKKETGGRMEIKLYPPGGIVKPLETFDAVSNGAIQMGFSSGIYNAGKIPESLVEFGLPFSFERWQQCYDFLYNYKDGQAMKLIREAYAERKLHLIVAGPSSSYGYMTKFPVKSLADFKGKKIRSFGSFGSLIKMMGGAPASIPAPEQYMALQRGTVDGTIFPYYTIETYNFKEVTKFITKPPVLATPTMNFYVNAKLWSKLPEDLRETVSILALKNFKWYSETAEVEEQKAISRSAADGVSVCTLAKSDIDQLERYGKKIWAGVAKKSDRTKTLVDLLGAYLAEQ